MASRPLLYIGNRNYSSWSLRVSLALRFMDFDFDVERLPLETPEFYARIRSISAAERVPVLHDGGAGWLYGERSIADALFAPVLLRLVTYDVPVTERCRPWVERMLRDAERVAWCAEALAETEIVEADETGVAAEV